MNKKLWIIIGIGLSIVIASGMIVTPLVFSLKMQQEAVDYLNEKYNEDFVSKNSTASDGIFTKKYSITVHSNITGANYDFDVDHGKYTGDYYSESVNAEINNLLAPHLEQGLAMANAHLELTEAKAAKDAGIEKLDIKILTPTPIEQAKVDELAAVVKQELGDVALQLETLYIDEPSIYDGLLAEIKNYFQYSDVSVDRFENFDVQVDTYTY